MCGIAGEIRVDGAFADTAAVARMTEMLAPRGPDGSGLVAQGRVAFGHRRLKIIDLSEKAGQPMTDSALGMTIVFNGCIYNYPELREQLIAEGYDIILAGGLDPENVGEALGNLGDLPPWGVDVATGVEGEGYRKDPARIQAFIAAVRKAEEAG